MKPDLTLSEAFELYRKDVIVYKNQSAKTEEMNQCAMKSIVAFLGDIPIAELEFDQVRKWTTDLRKTRTSNTVRGYILKLRVVLKYLKARGYECLDAEAVGIPKRDSRVVDYLEVGEVEGKARAIRGLNATGTAPLSPLCSAQDFVMANFATWSVPRLRMVSIASR